MILGFSFFGFLTSRLPFCWPLAMSVSFEWLLELISSSGKSIRRGALISSRPRVLPAKLPALLHDRGRASVNIEVAVFVVPADQGSDVRRSTHAGRPLRVPGEEAGAERSAAPQSTRPSETATEIATMQAPRMFCGGSARDPQSPVAAKGKIR